MVLQLGADRPVTTPVQDPVLAEANLTTVVAAGQGHRRRAPALLGRVIADVDAIAALVRRRIGPPAVDDHRAPAQLAAGARGERERQPAVGQLVGGGRQQVFAGEAPFDGWCDRANVGCGLQFFAVGVDPRHVTRSAFLEQQGCRAHHRFGVEAVPHQAVEHGVVDPDDGHPLVVCHVTANEGVAVVPGVPGGGEIDRLVEAVLASGAEPCEDAIVRCRFARSDHRGQSCRVRSDDHVVGEAADDAEPGNAELRVLVREIHVARVVCGL